MLQTHLLSRVAFLVLFDCMQETTVPFFLTPAKAEAHNYKHKAVALSPNGFSIREPLYTLSLNFFTLFHVMEVPKPMCFPRPLLNHLVFSLLLGRMQVITSIPRTVRHQASLFAHADRGTLNMATNCLQFPAKGAQIFTRSAVKA
jgi:hypothetical protein